MPPTATIPAHPPPPPPSESATTTSAEQQQPPPPAPPYGVESEAPPKRRKVEEVGFQGSPYYTIRGTVANLRGRFLQVCQGTDSQKKDAAVEILKEMKGVMELSKKTRLDLSSAAEPVKSFDKPAARAPEPVKSSDKPAARAPEPVKLFDKPAARAPVDKPAGKVPSAEKSQVPPTSLAGNFVHNTGGDVHVPLKPDNSDTAAHRLLTETKRGAKPSKTTDHTKQQGGLPQGSYVIGGSPIGWNFLMWPGCKAVYYGLTKAEWLARRSAK